MAEKVVPFLTEDDKSGIRSHLLAYNIIRELMVTAGAAKKGAEPREMSFKGTLQALTAFRDATRTANPERRAQLGRDVCRDSP